MSDSIPEAVKIVDMSLSNRCGNECVFCGDVRGELPIASTEQAARMLDEARRRGCDGLELSSKEFTLRPDAVELVRRARALGFRLIHLVTNGQAFAKDGKAAEFLDAGVNKLTISLHSDSAETEAAITGSRDGFKRKVAAVRNVLGCLEKRKGGCRFSINTVMTPMTAPRLDRVMDFVAGLGVERHNLFFPRIHPHMSRSFDAVVPRFSDLSAPLERGLDRGLARGGTYSVVDVPPCVLPKHAQSVCPRLKKDVLRGLDPVPPGAAPFDARREKVKGEPCRACPASSECEGVFGGYVERRGWSEFSPTAAGSAAPGEPRRVEVHLGTRCNNFCVFCMSSVDRDQKEDWAPAERVREELRHFYGKGCRAAGFLGGEPSVYPHIVECVAYARELGYERIALCTNGTRLSNPAFCARLVDAGLTRVTLSIHSHRPEIEDRLITGVPGNFARKLAAIGNLVALRRAGRLKDNVSLNPVLCGPTLKDMERYIAYFGDLGLDDVRFNYIWPYGSVRNDRAWVPSLKEAMPEILRVMLLNERRLGRHLSFGGIPRCALSLAGVSGRLADFLAEKYLDEAVFDPGNDVSMATDAGPKRFVWQEAKKNELKTKGPRCAGCRVRDRCEGVWKTYADLHGTGELSPL